VLAEEFHHDRFAGERDSGQPPASIAWRFADEKHARFADLFEIELKISTSNRVCTITMRVLVAGAIGNLRARKSIDESIEAIHGR